MKIKYLALVLLLFSTNSFAESQCEYDLFKLLDGNYNAAIDKSEFQELFKFNQGTKTCEETLEEVRKDRKPKHIMGKIHTAPSANFAPPANIAPAINYPAPAKFAPSRYFPIEEK